MENLYSFNMFNEYAKNGIAQSLLKCNSNNKKPIVVCVGSDLVLGDSLGPLVGTFLRKNNFDAFVYGTLNCPITAKEVSYAKDYLKIMHPNSVVIAIDAAVGDAEDVGVVKIIDKGLKPGLGLNKNLGVLGDISIIGVVATKSVKNYNLFNLTRLNLVYKMAEVISEGIMDYVKSAFINFGEKKFGA